MYKINKYFNFRNIILFLFLTLFLTSCFGESDDVKKAKKKMGLAGYENIEIDEDIVSEEIKDEKIKNYDNIVKEKIRIRKVSGDDILSFKTLDYNKFKEGKTIISGKTLGEVDKITVSFSNNDSEMPNDPDYLLNKFKKGNKTFKYVVDTKYKVVDFGLNKYIFKAYQGNKKSIYEILVIISINDDKYLDTPKNISEIEDYKEEVTTSKVLIGDEENVILADLPKGGDFGNVVRLGENSFTYSDIKGLEINKEQFSSVNCKKNEDTDNYFITEFLNERKLGYYFWNTCRDIVKGKGISFYVTRLEGKKYVFEKHYIDLVHGFYGIYELERGELEGLLDENADKNKILENKKKELIGNVLNYKEGVSVVNNLFKKIIK